MNEFQVQAGALRAAMRHAVTVTAGRHTIPVLGHVRLDAPSQGTLRVAANDLERSIITTAMGAGRLAPVTVSARRLDALLLRVPAEQTVTLDRADAGQLRVTTEGFVAQLYTLPAEDFPDPELPDPPDPKTQPVSLTLRSDALLRLMSRPAHAISQEGTRYYLNGILLHRRGDDLAAAATDGHRLFRAREPYPAEAETIPDVIVHRETCGLLRAALARGAPEAEVTLHVSHARLRVAARSWTITTKTIDGTFPKYENVIPEPTGARLAIHQPKQMAQLIDTLAAVSGERTVPIRLTNGTGALVEMQSRDANEGQCHAKVPHHVASWQTNGDHPEFGVNHRYLRHVCHTFRSGFTMSVKSHADPIHIAGEEGIAVLMPMRV